MNIIYIRQTGFEQPQRLRGTSIPFIKGNEFEDEKMKTESQKTFTTGKTWSFLLIQQLEASSFKSAS